MTNFRLTIEYDGRRYSGWQRQGNTDNTIQGKIEQILSRMTGHAVEINGAGRTDAGVHARAQVANVKIRTDKTAQEIQELLNHYLPQDIAVTACEQAPERFHARLNAKGKHYRYRRRAGCLCEKLCLCMGTALGCRCHAAGGGAPRRHA